MDIFRVVEIGGTHIKRADVTEDFSVTNILKSRTNEILKDKILDSLQAFTLENLNPKTKAIIVLAAGPVKEKSIIEKLPNFADFPQNTDIKMAFINSKLPVVVFNDMEAAVYGMVKLVNKKTPFWGLTWSTGIGGKFWDGEKISVNNEIGHLGFECENKNISCGCGGTNHAESFLGGKNLEKEIGQKLKDVTIAFKNGQSWAIDFYKEKAEIMGEFLVKLNQIASSATYMFKGSIATNILTDENIKNIIKKTYFTKTEKEIEIVLSPDPENDSLIGAIILVKNLNLN